MSLLHDLHAHSTASDGTLTPSELMACAHQAGVQVMALTDHDTLAGLPEARTSAEQLGLQFIPGVEISVSWGGQTVHIVGLNVDDQNAELQLGLAKLVEFRNWRAAEIGRRLDKAGYAGCYELAKDFSNGKLIGRTHFARALVQLGHADSIQQVFKKFLVNGKPGYVSGHWASLSDALSWISGAGGTAVIAHPARYRMTRTKLRKLIAEFAELGGKGIEVVSGSHSKDDVFTIAQHAKDFGLLASQGSDYHGPENPWVELGKLSPLPSHCTPIWQGWH